MRAPVATPTVTPHGAYNYWRQRSRRNHAGVDLAGARGTPVVAPEDLTVLAVRSASGLTSAPSVRGVGLRGYGPGAVLALGASGLVHVLGHLEVAGLPAVGAVVREGASVGAISDVGHVHWEVRRGDRSPWPKATRIADTVDPLALLGAATVREPDARAPSDVRKPDGSAAWLLMLVAWAMLRR